MKIDTLVSTLGSLIGGFLALVLFAVSYISTTRREKRDTVLTVINELHSKIYSKIHNINSKWTLARFNDAGEFVTIDPNHELSKELKNEHNGGGITEAELWLNFWFNQNNRKSDDLMDKLQRNCEILLSYDKFKEYFFIFLKKFFRDYHGMDIKKQDCTSLEDLRDWAKQHTQVSVLLPLIDEDITGYYENKLNEAKFVFGEWEILNRWKNNYDKTINLSMSAFTFTVIAGILAGVPCFPYFDIIGYVSAIAAVIALYRAIKVATKIIIPPEKPEIKPFVVFKFWKEILFSLIVLSVFFYPYFDSFKKETSNTMKNKTKNLTLNTPSTNDTPFTMIPPVSNQPLSGKDEIMPPLQPATPQENISQCLLREWLEEHATDTLFDMNQILSIAPPKVVQSVEPPSKKGKIVKPIMRPVKPQKDMNQSRN